MDQKEKGRVTKIIALQREEVVREGHSLPEWETFRSGDWVCQLYPVTGTEGYWETLEARFTLIY